MLKLPFLAAVVAAKVVVLMGSIEKEIEFSQRKFQRSGFNFLTLYIALSALLSNASTVVTSGFII